jgi:hypothetical protein
MELGYLVNESWPFQIKHQLIQLGACNARNLFKRNYFGLGFLCR